MRFRSLEIKHLKIPLKRAIGHHLAEYRHSEALVVTVTTDDGVKGWGEARPRPYLTGETMGSAKPDIEHLFASCLEGSEFASFPEVLNYLGRDISIEKSMLAAYCGLELAALDAAGKSFGCRVYDIIGSPREARVPRAANIDFDVKTADLPKICMIIRLQGYKAAKIKTGLEDDVKRIAVARECLGGNFFIWADANGAWRYDEALELIAEMKKYGVISFEQPLPAGQIEGMAALRRKTGAKLIADESLCSKEDARDLIRNSACDVMNIRIGKCGGIMRSLDLIALAGRNGLGYQLGSLVAETGILQTSLSRVTERVEGCALVEGLDQNNKLLQEDILAGPASKGLGFEVDEAKIAKFCTRL